MTTINIFNSTIEIGLRILILLNSNHTQLFNLEKLTYLDYLLLHSGDIKNAPQSLLPNSPYRFFEFHVNKEKIANAIEYLWKKGLIDVEYKENGIFYKSNRLTGLFVSNLKSQFSKELKNTALWVIKNFNHHTESGLKELFDTTLKSKKYDFKKIGVL